MLNNVPRCAAEGGSRLVKAKSSPNVSKPPSSKKQASQIAVAAIPPSRPSRCPKTPATRPSPMKTSPANDCHVTNAPRRGFDPSKWRLASPAKTARKLSPSETRADKRKVCKSASSSLTCTILEDRALLKKGLTYTPERVAPRRKASLDRSVSLSSVCNEASAGPRWAPVPSERRSTESPRKAPTPMNRSTSLWCVAQTQCRRPCARPSKIPLPAARSTGLGRSLADLSTVDRVGEPLGRLTSLQLERSTHERIYENCREALDRASKLGAPVSASTGSNLEERAARLMAQLEDDMECKEALVVEVDAVVAPSRRTDTVYEDGETKESNDLLNDNNKTEDREEENSKKRASTRSDETDEKPVQERQARDRSKESSIQELRRNWERQTSGDAKAMASCRKPSQSVSLPKATRTAGSNDIVDGAQRRKQCVGKRAKDIEHLVNFFNCKNAENSAKEPPREMSPVKPIMGATMRKTEKKNAEYGYGYASDGNCSEDSGHMSNENEVEWKDTVDSQHQRDEPSGFKDQRYLDRIHRDDDAKMFDSVGRLPEPEKKEVVRGSRGSPGSMSSGASSIDSCRDERCSENGRQVRVERVRYHVQ